MKKILIVIIVVLILLAIPTVYYGSIILVKNVEANRAETMAGVYVSKLYKEYSIVGQNCQGEDTNNDSYVSCDVRIRLDNATDTEKVLNLSCPTLWKSYTGSTCKESRLTLPGQN